MYNEYMNALGTRRSVIRELYEFGKMKAAEVGAENVFDFSLGNPSVPAPNRIRETLLRLISEKESVSLHGYTSAPGDIKVRTAVAENLNSRFSAGLSAENVYMTCGAAASLCITFKALNEDDDEIVLFAPYFPEYQVFVTSAGARPVTVPISEPDFQIDLCKLEELLSPRTKAVVVNSPNNPCGVIYTESTILGLCSLLKRKSEEYGHPIFIISDEPYRELVYDDIKVPFIMNYYDNSIVCYSFSKSLSLPGERIGYIVTNPKSYDERGLFATICGAGRSMGYVCAPSLFQKVIAECIDTVQDISKYRENRELIYESLKAIGYNCVHPDGAFYIFVKSLEADANAFSQRAKEYGLLLVPGDDFAAPGYVRIAYCVSNDMIRRSIPAFKALFESYC